MASPQNQEPRIDIVAQQPLSNTAARILGRYGFGEGCIQNHVEDHQQLITDALDNLGVAIELSHPASMEPVQGIHESDGFSVPQISEFHATYDAIRHNPLVKMTHDSDLVLDFLRKLGPTNKLRNCQGVDAGYELAHMRQLLVEDFAALPPALQRPERKVAIALLNEELALLWNPGLPALLPPDSPSHDMMYDLADPNVFSDAEVASLSPSDRWKIIGARLADEAANGFEEIVLSNSAPRAMKLDAMARMVDMRFRSHNIQLMTTDGKNNKAHHAQTLFTLAADHLKYVENLWENPKKSKGIPRGVLFEHIVLATKRLELLCNDKSKSVRLALPREDSPHPHIKPWVRPGPAAERVRFHSDVIIEDVNGNTAGCIQVKAMTHKEYKEGTYAHAQGVRAIYPKVTTTMVFQDTKEYREYFKPAA